MVMPNDRWMWDATATLEALGAADVCLWVWEPEKDRLRLTGATRALGLGPLAPDCSSAALRALALPQDRAYAEDILRPQEPGTEVAVRLRMRGSGVSIWRGVWLEEGVRAAGVVAPETRFAASDQDLLTGLLDRRSFINRAREQLQTPGRYEVIVADLDRLRRLNEALGHERADLVLAALGACSPVSANGAASEVTTRLHPTSGLAVIPLTVTTAKGAHHFQVEVAATAAEQERGLMWRTTLGADEGMIFPTDPPRRTAFWMRNTVIGLDIIFIGADHRVLNIAANAVPYDETPLPSAGAAAGVLELAAGRAAQIGLQPGDKVSW